MTRSLHRIAFALLLLFVAVAVAQVAWVIDEYDGSAPGSRYVGAVAEAGVFLVAAVIAHVGSALVEAIGRVRGSLIEAILETRVDDRELMSAWPELTQSGRAPKPEAYFESGSLTSGPRD